MKVIRIDRSIIAEVISTLLGALPQICKSVTYIHSLQRAIHIVYPPIEIKPGVRYTSKVTGLFCQILVPGLYLQALPGAITYFCPEWLGWRNAECRCSFTRSNKHCSKDSYTNSELPPHLLSFLSAQRSRG